MPVRIPRTRTIGIHAALIQEVPRRRSIRVRALGIDGAEACRSAGGFSPCRSQFRGSAIAREKLNQVVVDDLFQAGYNRVEGCMACTVASKMSSFPHESCLAEPTT
jgi:hypothetical protein